MAQTILVVDFGGQYNQLIARRVREANVYCELIPYTKVEEKISILNPSSVCITSGWNCTPYSFAAAFSIAATGQVSDAPRISERVFESGIPILGICYGCQLMADTLKGGVGEGPRGDGALPRTPCRGSFAAF